MAFQLQDLCEATSDFSIRQTLDNLPDGLFETYSRKLAKISKRYKSRLVQKIFMWITAAVRPLLLEELEEAVAFDWNDSFYDPSKLPHPNVIIASCENLLLLDEEGTVSFAHHTVQTFLLSDSPRYHHGDYHFSSKTANLLAANVCVTYLSFNDFEAQVAVKTQDIINVQSTAGISTGGLHALTKTLGISDSWFTLPYRLFGGEAGPNPKPVNIRWETAAPKLPMAPLLIKKYRFLEYAIKFWLTHTKYLPIGKQRNEIDGTLSQSSNAVLVLFYLAPWTHRIPPCPVMWLSA